MAVAAAVAICTGTMLSGSAHAAPALPRVPVSPVAADIPLMRADDVPLKLYVMGALTLEFKGNTHLIAQTGPDGLALGVRGVWMEADTSPSTPNSGTIIALKMPNATLKPSSVLQKATGGDLEMLLHAPVTVEVIDKATGETTLVGSTGPRQDATPGASDVKTFNGIAGPLSALLDSALKITCLNPETNVIVCRVNTDNTPYSG
ncbi:hypothetical protein [Streptomyces sp. AC550_RSS872]|uniref:hypothetical protein n=1 Tax=Streptomyces sp. AC550_RSS872 TaxID=2823689 RepID=UPI001C26A0C5|nr:hypothetical protein [Streptomyces sp. AC550_RSS872]